MRRRTTLTPEERTPVIDPARARKRTMDRAVRLLAAKPRSIREIRDRLLEKPWTNEQIVDAVIAKLREYNYLDDAQFARDLALSKLRQKPQGKRRLEQRLSQKKLDRDTLASAISNAYEVMPESQLIDTAIDKRVRLKGFPTTHDEKKKFTEHLMRQGFDYGLIRERLNALEPPED